MRTMGWFLLAALTTLLVSPLAAQEPAKELPQVVILATGGTIAGVASSETDAGYKPGSLSVDVLIEAVPEISKLARVRGEQVANIASQDMTDAIWLTLAQRINALLASEDVDGVVVTHGTDTLEETAYFLHLVTRSSKPVVLTGSMRASTSLSADGPLNLFNAVAVAACPEAAGRGVLVALDDQIHCARDVTKGSTTAVESFTSPQVGPQGSVYYGEIEFNWLPSHPHTLETPFEVEGLQSLPRVDILFAHENMQGDLVDACVKNGAAGIVVAGVGNGNMSQGALDALAQAVKDGVQVVRSSRILRGPTLRNHEVDDDALGFVASDTLIPQKARILLKLALARKTPTRELQEMFYRF